jgi:hypothetical protein
VRAKVSYTFTWRGGEFDLGRVGEEQKNGC